MDFIFNLCAVAVAEKIGKTHRLNFHLIKLQYSAALVEIKDRGLNVDQ